MSTTVLLMWRIQQKLIGDWLLIIQYVIDVESESGLYLEMASLRSQQNYKKNHLSYSRPWQRDEPLFCLTILHSMNFYSVVVNIYLFAFPIEFYINDTFLHYLFKLKQFLCKSKIKYKLITWFCQRKPDCIALSDSFFSHRKY